jgi:hypothetical protein
MLAGAGQNLGELAIYDYNGTAWVPYSTTDLAYDGTYASFTATAMGDYAGVATPEPGTLVLFGSGLLGLVGAMRRS